MRVILSNNKDQEQLQKILKQNHFLYEIHEIDGEMMLFFDDIYFPEFHNLTQNFSFKSIDSKYNLKLVTRVNHPLDSVYKIGDTTIGGKEKTIIAGPCAVENYETMKDIVTDLQNLKIKFLRAGAFKPRTNPYSFQGLEIDGLEELLRLKKETGILLVSEITKEEDLPFFEKNIDIIQVGARNMQNFALLKALGTVSKPILLKRGFNNSIEEFLCAAEYIMLNGNDKVILCERGIRTPLSYTRNTLDIGAIPVLKRLTHLPVFVDPSHASGYRDIVKPLALASLCAGADGLIMEVHNNPSKAYSDSQETIGLHELQSIIEESKKLN